MNLINPIHIKNLELDLDLLGKEILLNKEITLLNLSNLYEILYQSDNFKILTDTIIQNIKSNTNENFNCFIKSLYGYICDNINKNKLTFNKKQLKEGLKPSPKYSFIFGVKSEMEIILYLENKPTSYVIEESELLIFNTKDFLEDNSSVNHRLAIAGSITNDIEIKNLKKYSSVI